MGTRPIRELALEGPALWAAWALAVLVGCGPSGLGREPIADPTVLGPIPRLESFAVDCNVDAGTWTLSAAASTWTGGGATRWTRDLQYVEQHEVSATSSAPDRGREELQLVLGIVSDWRAQTAGRSTVFTCAEVPTVVFDLRSAAGDVVDCAAVGPRADEVFGLPELGCAEADTGTGTGGSGATPTLTTP